MTRALEWTDSKSSVPLDCSIGANEEVLSGVRQHGTAVYFEIVSDPVANGGEGLEFLIIKCNVQFLLTFFVVQNISMFCLAV